MNKTILIAAFGASILVGCATPNDLRKKTPDLVLESGKEAKKIAICIADKWENSFLFGGPPVSVRETNEGYMVTMQCNTNTCFLADITAATQKVGSKTSFYSNTIGTGEYETYTKECQ